jgi:hypothetical protein
VLAADRSRPTDLLFESGIGDRTYLNVRRTSRATTRKRARYQTPAVDPFALRAAWRGVGFRA